MCDILIAEALLIFLQILVVCRPFFAGYRKKQKRDTLSAVPALTLCASGLLFFCFGCRITVIAVCIISLLIFLTNISRFITMCRDLRRGYFSFFFKLMCVLEFALLCAAFVFLVIFRPLCRPSSAVVRRNAGTAVLTPPQKDDGKTGISGSKFFKQNNRRLFRNTILLRGSCLNGFDLRENIFDEVSARITVIYPSAFPNAEAAQKLPVILFLPDAGVNVQDCLVHLEQTAEDGYCVIAADICARDAVYPSEKTASFALCSFSVRARAAFRSAETETLQKEIIRCRRMELDAFIKAFPVLKTQLPIQTDAERVYIAGGGTICSLLSETAAAHSDVIAHVYSSPEFDEWANGAFGIPALWTGDLEKLDPAEYAALRWVYNNSKAQK
ncbi:MAG: hypothetical protein NC041_00320 [Bacteroides sp.]|nr:hypothetical protein [Prevotella sp.]MCM1408612.1 hypothetical protein [Treponema brennaborense]MCM1468900.1 hypothetical protein [Bacteroides sp.]